jgi:hypothetical protein
MSNVRGFVACNVPANLNLSARGSFRAKADPALITSVESYLVAMNIPEELY